MSYHKTNITANPFDMPVVKKLIDKYLNRLNFRIVNEPRDGTIDIVDPFCNKQTIRRQGTNLITNDLNPKFNATYNLEANDFAELCLAKGYEFDLVLFDPPYSLRQLKEQYENIGYKLELWQTQNKWGRARNALAKCVRSGGYAISFGWETSGFSPKRGFELQEILVLNQAGHADRYDLLIAVEKKITTDLFKYISCYD